MLSNLLSLCVCADRVTWLLFVCEVLSRREGADYRPEEKKIKEELVELLTLPKWTIRRWTLFLGV